MGLLDLNEDVLLHVVSFLRPRDALSFAKTCRYADVLTTPRRLSQVTLRTGSAVRGFCDFCLAAPRSRPQHIRDLTVTSPWPDFEAAADHLAEVITLAARLRLLSLFSLEYALQRCPALKATLAAKTTLTAITLDTPVDGRSLHPAVRELLITTASRITCLELYWWAPSDAGWTMLAALAGSLRTFRVREVLPRFVTHAPPAGLTCAGVHTLRLSTLCERATGSFAKFFPGVRALSWDGIGASFVLSLPDAHWPLLDHLVCRRSGYPPLSLDTHVRRVDILSANPESERSFSLTIAPVVLSYSTVGSFPRDYIPQLPLLVSQLRYLSYTESRASWDEPALGDLLSRAEYFADAFAALPLLGLTLDLHLKWNGGSRFTLKSSCDPVVAAAAAAVASRIRTLKFVCIRGGRIQLRDDDAEEDRDVHGWFEVTARDEEGAAAIRRLSLWEEDAVENKLLALTA